MSGAMRDVLKGRYLAYRKKGLDGLAPYQFRPVPNRFSPSAELIARDRGHADRKGAIPWILPVPCDTTRIKAAPNLCMDSTGPSRRSRGRPLISPQALDFGYSA